MFQLKAAITAQSTVVIVTTSVSTNPLPIVAATAPPNKRAGEIEECSHRDRLARRQYFGRDDRRDRVGGIVKAVAVFENDRGHYDEE